MGQTRVDLLHLLEDLRDAYPGDLEETILTEIVANSLDSGATEVILLAEPEERRLLVVDDGSGMARRELARYHDVAASSKTRGRGIGFAGVGIKLGLLACEHVVTETRRGRSHVATRWHLATRHKAPWQWVAPAGWIAEHGTGVSLTLKNPLSPLLDPGALESTLRRHFTPLLDETFDEILTARYPQGVAFRVNGRLLARERADPGRSDVAVRFARKRKPSAFGYVLRGEGDLPEDRRGLAISTLGKVIRRGWDWVGMTPTGPERIGGLIEAPGLAESLTLSKADFIRSGRSGVTYLTYRKAIQEALSPLFLEWGEASAEDSTRHRRSRPLERDLEEVLVDLAEAFPLLATLVEQRSGGQRSIPATRGGDGPVPAQGMAAAAAAEPGEMQGSVAPEANGVEPPPASSDRASDPPPVAPDPGGPRAARRRPGRYGLSIQFEERPHCEDLGRLVESTVWVNVAHPAYQRARASRSEAYHVTVTVALALAPLAAEPGKTREFVTALLSRWGEAHGRDGGRGQRRAKTRQARPRIP